MQIIHNRFRTLSISITVALLLLVTGYVLMLKVIDLDTYKEQILAELSKSLNRPVTYKSGVLTFSFGPAFSFENVLAKEPNGSTDFVSVDRLTCRIDLLPLFRKQIIVRGIVADKPVIHLERRKDGTFNISDLLEAGVGKGDPLKVHNIKFKNGDITFIDNASQQEPLVTRLARVDVTLDNLGRGKKIGIKLSAGLGEGTTRTFSLNGKLHMAPLGTPLVKSSLDAKITTKQLDVGHFWSYYRQYVPFNKIVGALDTESEFHGMLDQFTASGKIALSALRFDYQPIFKSPLSPKSLTMKYNMEMTKADINVKSLEINIDGAEINGSCAIRDYRNNDPRITAQAISSNLDLAKYQQYIPYGIIVKHVAAWIEEHIKGGVYKLVDGRLDGRVSQIAHMEKGDNYNVLYIKALAEKGVVTYGNDVPAFNNIKGVLELKGKDFFLHTMSGKFGDSPLTLEGRITDYPLDTPSGYPFKMTISPSRNEIAWLLGKNKSSQFSCNGSSSLSLQGDGYTSGYHLSGEWNLTPTAYSYSNLVTKPVGTSSTINFRGLINQREAILTSLHYTLGGLSLDVSAKYPYASSRSLELLLNTNSVNIESFASLSPLISRYQPSGRLQLSLRGVTPDPDNGTYLWSGIAALTNTSFRYSPTAKPLSAITGTVAFNDSTIETSQLTIRVGSTTFSGRGAISSLKPFAFNTSFTSPRIDMTDFGFVLQKKPMLITAVRGELSYKENNLSLKALSGNLNNSQMTIKGVIADLDTPKADLNITSSNLDIEDLIIISSLDKNDGQSSQKITAPTMKAVISADKGTFNEAKFEKLSATINTANRVIEIQPLEADIFGGKLTANGVITTNVTPPRYQADFRLANAAAAEVIHYLTIDKKELTGELSLGGELSSRGETYDAMKRAVIGNITIHAHKGSIRQFPALSKVFSILNISQLFKLKLPDMVVDGMPYNDIKGTATVKDGNISTNDLFIASNAMNMSLVGHHDFINDNLDFTLGIQPLQTVDKVVSHIPIVGWILTGKEKALISAYFEIKGKSTAPHVSAIPVKAMGKGVLGIFKRLFQLPAKLVTDTGEVILGN